MGGGIQGKNLADLERALKAGLPAFRWFGGKSRVIRKVNVIDTVPLPQAGPALWLLVCRVVYTKGRPDYYFVPVDLTPGPGGAISLDPAGNPEFATALIKLILSGASFWTGRGRLLASCSKEGRNRPGVRVPAPSRLKGEQSNTSIRYGQTYMLKMMRRLELGVSPEVEIGRHLAGCKGYTHSPRFLGTLEYVRPGHPPVTLCSVHRFMPARGDAWTAFLDRLAKWKGTRRAKSVPALKTNWLEASREPLPRSARRTLVPFLDWAELLGQRTGSLHGALATGNRTPGFVPEPMSIKMQTGLAKALAIQVGETLAMARRARPRMPAAVQADIDKLLALECRLHTRFAVLRKVPLPVMVSRTHGDYHLGQVLFTGRDFLIIDFEGEPARSLEERRRKHSPLRDVAGMLRSFHYAASVGLSGEVVAARWYEWICAAYLRGYRATVRAASLPADEADLRLLLDLYLLEKALYELRYELNNRPDWVHVPLAGILNLMEE